ncbi:DUF5719 family protein [Kribbella speibonae]|uniref:Secreted protein n=1 Tax=Kribbella speibonae TaxID=1572660 RepID=A0A4R0IPM9_9ACTN|nr:DUF5719 family protein [Kribbella speibonae]TCC27446.1 hypothetical protein E0H58_05630 [Kribbella speibonae]TCC35691.1 hypothetical protein E0H92_23500 [Kribbella speibonae]
MSRLLSDPRLRIGAVVVAMAALAGIGLVIKPEKADTRAQAAVTEPARTVVNRTALSCPVLSPGGKMASVVNGVAPTLPEGTPTAPGTAEPLTIAPLPTTSDPVGSLLKRGTIGSSAVVVKPEPLSIKGTGPLAAGTVGTSTTTAQEGVNRGMASVPCQVPGSDFWFVGASGAVERRDVLVLTNLDSINAEVNVSVYARNGAQDLPAARGIVVPALGTFELFLKQVAPNLRDLALHVESTGGRVAAAVRSNASNGSQPAGVDWLNTSAAPATKVFVPAVAPGAGLRILSVANPTDLQATASLTVNGPNGPFKPAGLETVQIEAGSVKTFMLDSVLHGDASAITVTSDQPVTASVRSTDASRTEFSSIGSAEALTGPAYLVIPAHQQPAVLQVTAPGKTGSVKFELRDAADRVLTTRALDIVGGATTPISFPAQPRPTYLMVQQTRGTVVAGVTLMPAAKPGDDDVPQVAAWPLTTSLVFRAQLGAQPDVSAALR